MPRNPLSLHIISPGEMDLLEIGNHAGQVPRYSCDHCLAREYLCLSSHSDWLGAAYEISIPLVNCWGRKAFPLVGMLEGGFKPDLIRGHCGLVLSEISHGVDEQQVGRGLGLVAYFVSPDTVVSNISSTSMGLFWFYKPTLLQ